MFSSNVCLSDSYSKLHHFWPHQESVLQPEDEVNGSKPGSLAASLSATVASRARYFEELSRRRLLRLGVETDLQAARVKLDTLLATATASTLMLDHPKGSDCDHSDRGEEREGKGENPSQHDYNDGDATHDEAGKKGDCELIRKAAHRKEVDSPATNDLPSKRGEVSGTTAGGGPGGGRGIGSQQPKRRMGRSRGNAAVLVNAPAATAPSQHKRRFPAPEETTAARTPPQPKNEESRNSSTAVAENTIKPTLNNRKKKTGLDPRHKTAATEEERPKKQEKAQTQSIADTTVGHDNASNDSKSVSAAKSGSLAERELQEKREASEHSPNTDDIQVPGGSEIAGGRGAFRHEDSLAGDDCAAAASTEEKSYATVGEDASPPENGIKNSSTNTAPTTGLVQDNSASPRIFGRARSPRTSPRRTKGAPSSAAQLRRLPVSPRRGRTNDSGDIGQSDTSRKTAGEQLENSSNAADESRPTETIHAISNVRCDGTIGRGPQSLEASSTELNEDIPSSDSAVGEIVTDITESVPQAVVVEPACTGEGDGKDMSKKNGQAHLAKKPINGRVSGGPSHGKVARVAIAQRSTSRSLGKTAKTKPAVRARGKTPTRLGITTKAKRISAGNCTDDATGPIPETLPPDSDVAAREAEDAQTTEETQVDSSLGEELISINTTDKTVGEGEPEGSGTARSTVTNKKVENGTTTAEKISKDSCLDIPHNLTATSVQDVKAAGNDGGGRGDVEEAGGTPTEACGCGFTAASEQSVNGHNVGDDHLLPQGVVDLAEALGVEVDRLRLEKAELEDTIAQLNVAAAQLYFVEYEQMKVCGRAH